MNTNLQNKVVLITGSTSGIGEYIAYGFAREKAIPVLVGRDASRGEHVLKAIREMGVDTIFLQAELTRQADCKKLVEEAVAHFGRLDVVVNNAGINDGVGLNGTPEEFMESIRKNLFHYFAIVHYAKEELIRNRGNIINIGSKVANTGQGNTSGYAASKGGIQALTREWAVSFLPHLVRVNEVIPAETWTPLYEKWVQSFPDPAAKLASITRNIPLGKRMTTSEEIANMVVFLASDLASHITGQLIYVDGGYTHLDRSI
jgi:L-fucose dehydrogenase